MSSRMFTVTVKEFKVDENGDLTTPRVVRQGFIMPPNNLDRNAPISPNLLEQLDDAAIEEIVNSIICDLGLCGCGEAEPAFEEQLADPFSDEFPSDWN